MIPGKNSFERDIKTSDNRWKRAESMELLGDKSLCRAIFDASSDCIKVLDIEGRIASINAHGRLALEVNGDVSLNGRVWLDLWPAESAGLIREVIAKAWKGEASRFTAFCPTFKGTPKWWDISVSPILDEGEPFNRLLVISRDITDRRNGEEQKNLLIHELNHRVKNILATVQAIMSLTARAASTIGEFQESFFARIGALAKAHSFLTDERWQTMRLNDIIAVELEAYTEKFVKAPRLAGPIVDLASDNAVLICMVIHELTTNAAKYGALYSPEGRIDLSWRLRETASGNQLIIDWVERGGPPAKTPERQGFGTTLLERILRGQLKAVVDLSYESKGLAAHFEIPLNDAETPSALR